MAKSKNTFLKSKMNKDLDARIIGSNEYRNAVNVQVNKSEGEQVGSLENVLGNTNVGDVGAHTGVSNLTCIGYVVDDSKAVAYLFFTDQNGGINDYSPSGNNFIITFNSSDNSLTTLVQGAFLNFSTQFPIYGANVLENLLFWTDNKNQPRKINIDSATNISNYYTTEDQISVAKYNPHPAIELYAESTLSTSSTDEYESTMKDTTSFYLPNGGKGNIQNNVSAGASQVNLRTLEGDIIEAGGAYGSVGAKVYYTTSSVPPSIVDTGTTVSSLNYNSSANPPVWEITVTGGTLPTLSAFTQDIVFNANPYYDKDYAGDPTYLEDKFVRFAYRFKFDDDEYSLFSTFTQAAFIPKQDGYFMYVNKPSADNIDSVNDQDEAYRSTIVSFVENKVDNIKLRIPLPFNNYELENLLKVKSMELLYKESDQLPVKVIDTVDIDTIFNSAAKCQASASTTTTSLTVDNVQGGINVGDRVTGFGILGTSIVTVSSYAPDDPNENPSTSGTITLSSAQNIADDTVLTIGEPDYYTYNYNSKKPIKTLPERDLIRVYDKVPVRAFAQEVSGNRVIYGNFQDKHNAPDSLNYNVAISPKSELALNEVTVDADAIATGSTTITFTNYTPKGGSTIQIGYIVICPGIPEGTMVTAVTAGAGNTGTITIDNATTAPINLGQIIIIKPGNDVQNTTSIIEYPNHSVKTNRNYQVGVVLSDRYGRQSGVILSNNKELITVGQDTFIGSTVYSPYNNESIDPDEWPGDSIKLLFNETIATTGAPGVYNGDSTSSDYNPLGWYSFKIVVKQTEQDYYNVYLPGIMAAYPDNTTLEIGETSHAVLISDNINKVPRDLAEVGPVQNQFRSSVKLYGRVENSNSTIDVTPGSSNIGLSNLQYYPGRTSDFASTIATVKDLFDFDPNDPPNPNFFPQFYSLESDPYIARINTANKIGQVANVNFNAVSATVAVTATTDTLQITSISGDEAEIEIGDSVVGPGFPTDLVVAGSGFTGSNVAKQNAEVASSGFTGTTFQLSTAGTGSIPIAAGQVVETTTGVPEGTVVLNVSGSIASPPFEIEVNNVVQVTGGQLLNFIVPAQLVVSSAVSVALGDEINVYSADAPGIQHLAVYETEPVESLLDIFWETSTTGIVKDINDIIINENLTGTGAAGFSPWNDNPFNESLRSGEDCLQSPIYLVDNFGSPIAVSDQTPLVLESVIDGNGLNVQTAYTALGVSNPVFSLSETTLGSRQYMIKTAPGFVAEIWYGADVNARNFTFNFSATVNGLPFTKSEQLNLGNTQPHIPTAGENSADVKVLKNQTGVTVVKVYSGSSASNISSGWNVTTTDTSNPLPSGLQTSGNSYSPPGNPIVPFGVINDVSNNNTFVAYNWPFASGAINVDDMCYLTTQGFSGNVPEGTCVLSIQDNTPVNGQMTVTLSNNITINAFGPSSNSKLEFGSPATLEVSQAVTVVKDQLLSCVDASELWDDCPLPPFEPGSTSVRYIGELKAVNGAGWRSTDLLGNTNKYKDLTFTKISEVRGAGTPGEQTITPPGYFGFENPGPALFNSAAKVDLVNNGYQDSNMPSDVYTITYEVSDPGGTTQCKAIVKTGLQICELQEWTVDGYYATSCSSNTSTGQAYQGKFIIVKVCDPGGDNLFGTGINGYYAWVSGSNTAENSGDFPSWQNLISSNGSSNILLDPYAYLQNYNPPSGWDREGWSAQFFQLYDFFNDSGVSNTQSGILSMLARQEEITGGCLVYAGPYAPSWTLTAGTGTSTPLSPSTSNYQFSFVY